MLLFRKDTGYCGKSHGIKVYRSKHYLLLIYRELVFLYNKENDSDITCHQLTLKSTTLCKVKLQQIIASVKPVKIVSCNNFLKMVSWNNFFAGWVTRNKVVLKVQEEACYSINRFSIKVMLLSEMVDGSKMIMNKYNLR